MPSPPAASQTQEYNSSENRAIAALQRKDLQPTTSFALLGPIQSFDPLENRAVSSSLAKLHSPAEAPKGPDRNIDTTSSANPADLDLDALNRAFYNASLTSSGDTRLLLSFPSRATLTDSAAVRLKHAIGAWGLVGVLQRTRDVRFCIDIPVYDTPSPRFIPHRAKFDIYYDPSRDSCVLENRAGVNVFLQCLCPNAAGTQVEDRHISTLEPGLWRISWKENQYVLDMLILRRRFTVAIDKHLIDVSAPGKRKARDEPTGGASLKRSKQQNDEKTDERTEVLLLNASLAESASATTVTSTGGAPLLQLLNGDTALVRASLQSTGRSHTDDTAVEYEVTRHEGVLAVTPTAKVFAAKHTEHEGGIVAKVVKYNGQNPRDLISCAKIWLREVRYLQRLNHRNILSLKSSDGRLFALYLERLPASLQKGVHSPFSASDAHIILRDMSSALQYLSKEGVVHNDIKPSNITYSPERGAVLIDFGLATLRDQEQSNGGTPWYVPPEFGTDVSRNFCGDVWALGVTMLYVLAKMKLPESTRGWMIRDAVDETSKANQQMLSWVQFVIDAREQLNTMNPVENLIYKMLEREAVRRIQPVQMLAAFGSSADEEPDRPNQARLGDEEAAGA